MVDALLFRCVQVLNSHTPQEQERPIVFIGYSFGGLLIKQVRPTRIRGVQAEVLFVLNQLYLTSYTDPMGYDRTFFPFPNPVGRLQGVNCRTPFATRHPRPA